MRIGRMHARNIATHPRVRLVTVCNIHRPAADEVANALGVPVAETADAVFGSGNVDAVLIASATKTHAALIERAVALALAEAAMRSVAWGRAVKISEIG